MFVEKGEKENKWLTSLVFGKPKGQGNYSCDSPISKSGKYIDSIETTLHMKQSIMIGTQLVPTEPQFFSSIFTRIKNEYN